MSKDLNYRIGRTSRHIEQSSNSHGFFGRINRSINRMSGTKFSIITIFLIGVIGFLLFFAPDAASRVINSVVPDIVSEECKDILNPSCWTDTFFPELPEDEGMTNALLIGLDTREAGDSGSGLMNTDTMMLASFDHKSGKVYLISFPRDLYVPYRINGKGPYYQKINAVYAAGQTSKAHNGMEVLKENMEDWMNIKIHYTAEVNFSTVIDIVDALGGVKVNVEKDYTDVYPYKELPADLQKDCSRAVDLPLYCVFDFEKGEHELDGEHALIYARMRQYSSDFDRARRQQQVVDAIKDKFVEGDMSLIDKVKFAWDTYKAISDKDNVKSNIDYNTLLAGMKVIDDIDHEPVQIVLDPTFGGGGYFVPDSIDGIYVVKIKGNNFDLVNAYISNLKKNPDIYKEAANVLLANASGIQATKSLELTKEKLPFKYLNYVSRTKSEESGTIIYVFDNTKVETLNFLKDYYETSKVRFTPEDWSVKQSGYKEDILVIEGPKAVASASPTDEE